MYIVPVSTVGHKENVSYFSCCGLTRSEYIVATANGLLEVTLRGVHLRIFSIPVLCTNIGILLQHSNGTIAVLCTLSKHTSLSSHMYLLNSLQDVLFLVIRVMLDLLA